MDQNKTTKASKLFYCLVAVCVLTAVVGWASGLYDLIGNWRLYLKNNTSKLTMIMRCLVVVWGLFTFYWMFYRIRKKGLRGLKRRKPDWFIVRAGFYTLLPALIAASILKVTPISSLPEHTFIIRSAFYTVLWAAWILWSLFGFRRLLDDRENSKNKWFGKIIDIVCMNCLVFLILGESLSVAVNHLFPSVFMQIGNMDVATRVNALRQEPGKLYFNFYLNSRGYHDEEFFIAENADLVVGFLGDSFGLGVVPYDFNFVTIAERHLQHCLTDSFERIAIHNVSMPGIAMEEYVWLLQTEILPLKPSLVVVCLFLGNDIAESAYYGITEHQKHCFQNWSLYQYMRKGFLFIKEAGALRQKGATFNLSADKSRKTSGAMPEHVTDSSKEKPYFSKETFIRIERMRFEVCDPFNSFMERGFDGVFRGLRFFQDTVGDNLLVMLIPDEFQVNDDLYAELLKIKLEFSSYPRDYPQQRLLEFCAMRNIRCLDLLPILREGQKQDRTYHLQDTHLNAYGNRLVGSALGDELTQIVKEKGWWSEFSDQEEPVAR